MRKFSGRCVWAREIEGNANICVSTADIHQVERIERQETTTKRGSVLTFQAILLSCHVELLEGSHQQHPLLVVQSEH